MILRLRFGMFTFTVVVVDFVLICLSNFSTVDYGIIPVKSLRGFLLCENEWQTVVSHVSFV